MGDSQETEPALGWRRYSTKEKLRRVLAFRMRFTNNARVDQEVHQAGSLTSTELSCSKPASKEGTSRFIWVRLEEKCSTESFPKNNVGEIY